MGRALLPAVRGSDECLRRIPGGYKIARFAAGQQRPGHMR
jgi:hypothetical protein